MTKTLLTGSSGFLGSYILHELKTDNIITLARRNAYIKCDLVNNVPYIKDIDRVIHAAGKAHAVPKNKEEANEFFLTNVNGTRNLLKGLEHSLPRLKLFIFISSVSVYGLTEGNQISESHPLLAADPYGSSKIEAEEIIRQWCKSNDIICTILRLPLIVGPNPIGNLASMIHAIQKGYYFNISGIECRKSMVLASDIVELLNKNIFVDGIFNLTDGYHPKVNEVGEILAKKFNKDLFVIPYWLAFSLGKIGDLLGNTFPLNSIKISKLTRSLTFDDSKARKILGWRSNSVLKWLTI